VLDDGATHHNYEVMKTLVPLAAVLILSQIGSGLAAASPMVTQYEVKISLSPKAGAKLQASGETITIAAYYFGLPKKGHKVRVNPEGEVDLGDEKKIIKGEGTAQLGGIKINAKLLKHVEGEEPSLLTSIYTSRTKFPDNLLNCDVFQDKVSLAAKNPIQIKCKLIGE